MRRTLAAVVAALALPVSALAAAPAPAEESRERVAERPRPPERALVRASQVLAGAPEAPDQSATLALRDLFASRPALTDDERHRADRLLVRPTDRGGDPMRDGYTRPARRTCSGEVCVHWVRSGADAPPGRAWVDKTLQVMRQAWRHEVGTLGYTRPPRDGSRGGSGHYDVYLADVGQRGIYGYAAPEQRRKGRTASSYIVLDNDFSRAEFGQSPEKSLKATAAHEFFHAVQFAHDYRDDGWFMEATATWMEERVFDGVNDNRQYLRSGQMGAPGSSLDAFGNGVRQYGNWAFFEYLSQRFGNKFVRSAWRKAAHYDGAPKLYSIQAVLRSLPRQHSWESVFRAYAAGNTIPDRVYSEGAAWPSAPARSRHTLTATRRGAGDTVSLRHLASHNVFVRPGESVRGEPWRLAVKVNGPARATSPAAYLLVHRTGGEIQRRAVQLDRDGVGTAQVRFGSSQVDKVTLTLANASTRFLCNRGTQSSCHGTSRDDGVGMTYRLRATKG